MLLSQKKDFYTRFSDIAYITAKILAAVLALLLVFSARKSLSLYDEAINAFYDNTAESTLPFFGLGGVIVDDKKPMDIRIPRCESFHLSIADKNTDFTFTNPETNNCYLRVTITRHDTNETAYTSSLISPGKTIENISLSTKFSHFTDYDAMIKVDAYSLDGLSFLNSLVMDAVIYTY